MRARLLDQVISGLCRRAARAGRRLRTRLDRNALVLDGLGVEGPGVVRGIELPLDAPDALVARNKHGLYCVPRLSAHRPCAAAILLGEVWESKILDVMCQDDSEADVVHA